MKKKIDGKSAERKLFEAKLGDLRRRVRDARAGRAGGAVP